MKRWLLVLLMLCLLTLSGCSEGAILDHAAELFSPKSAAPMLVSVELTEKSLELLNTLGSNRKHDNCIFDFTVPEGTKQVSIMQWELKDGEWVIYEGDHLVLNRTKGRIGLSWDALCNDANVVLRTDEYTLAISHHNPEDYSVSGLQTVTILQSMDTEIVLEQEIPLLMQIVTNAVEAPIIPLNCYPETERYAGHEQVTLVTVRFSAVPLESTEPPLA